MSRSRLALSALLALLVITPAALPPLVGVAPGAPVPKHLMPHPQYFPTEVGTRWVYAVSGDEDAEVTETILSAEEEDGVRNVALRVTHDYVDPVDRVKTTEIAVRRMRVSRQGVSVATWWSAPPELRLLQLPHQPGNRWGETHPDDSLGKAWARKCEAFEPERVVVPAGVYQAVRVETVYSFDGKVGRTEVRHSDDWYAPGVGLVKQQRRDINRTKVLKSFIPGKV